MCSQELPCDLFGKDCMVLKVKNVHGYKVVEQLYNKPSVRILKYSNPSRKTFAAKGLLAQAARASTFSFALAVVLVGGRQLKEWASRY